MIIVTYSEQPSPWGTPNGISLPVLKYTDRNKQVGRNHYRTGDLWVCLPDGQYARIATKDRFAHGQIILSDTIPGTLIEADTLPFRYSGIAVGKFIKNQQTIYMDGKRVPEPILILPGMVYLTRKQGEPFILQEYYYTFGLRTDVVYTTDFDEYQHGQKIRINFYTRGLTVMTNENFKESRNTKYTQRIIGYYILHKLRTV